MELIAGLVGEFLGALLITFLVTRAAIKFAGRTRKGAVRTFFIGFGVTCGFRIAAWLVLDNGHGEILGSLFAYVIALAIWLRRDYQNAEPALHLSEMPSASCETPTMSSRINALLDHPFKRIAALVAGLGLPMLLMGWLQIVARYWDYSSCAHVIANHILLDDTEYALFTYGFYMSIFGLFGSVFYNRTVGRVVAWVRTGA